MKRLFGGLTYANAESWEPHAPFADVRHTGERAKVRREFVALFHACADADPAERGSEDFWMRKLRELYERHHGPAFAAGHPTRHFFGAMHWAAAQSPRPLAVVGE